MKHNSELIENRRNLIPLPNMSTVKILTPHVKALDGELGRHFPRVEKVEPLVVKALAVVRSGKPSEQNLESTGML